MSTAKLTPKKKVMIYQDPITCLIPEGEAILLKEYRPDCGDGLSIWVVEFLDGGYKTTRTIKSMS